MNLYGHSSLRLTSRLARVPGDFPTKRFRHSAVDLDTQHG